MGKFFTDNDRDSLIHFQVPKVLILGERYKSMKPNALKLYIVLLDRMKLSLQNGWKDSNGNYYVRMSQDRAAELFGWSPTTFRAMKKELEKFDLLSQDREGQGKSNRLYIKQCDYDENDTYKINKVMDLEFEIEEENAKAINEKQKNNFKSNIEVENEMDFLKDKSCSSADNIEKNKSCSSRRTKVDLLEGQKLTPNNNKINNNKFSNNEIVNLQIVNLQEKGINNFLNKNDFKISLIDACNSFYTEFSPGRWNKQAWNTIVNKFVEETINNNRNETIPADKILGYAYQSIKGIAHKHDIKYGKKKFEYPKFNDGSKIPYYNWLAETEFDDDDDVPY